MALSAEIKKRRKELGLTLAELAKMVGVSEATVQRWESGNIKTLRYGRIEVLASALQTTPMALQGWGTAAEKEDEKQLDSEIAARLAQLTPEEWLKVDAFVQGLLASR